MDKQEFCKIVVAFIEDEANAEKEYADFKSEIEYGIITDLPRTRFTVGDIHQIQHFSMDEANHKRFWKEINEKVCK